MAAPTVEFNFNDVVYRKIDSVAIGPPLVLAHANIFVGYYEDKLSEKVSKPLIYCRYVRTPPPSSTTMKNGMSVLLF